MSAEVRRDTQEARVGVRGWEEALKTRKNFAQTNERKMEEEKGQRQGQEGGR